MQKNSSIPRSAPCHRALATHINWMWDYPKSAKHQAFINQLQVDHARELAKVRVQERERSEDARPALDEIRTNVIATRAKTARLRAERLARLAANPGGKRRTSVR
jgi:hypothetical protein